MKNKFSILMLAMLTQVGYAQPTPSQSAPIPPNLTEPALTPKEQADLQKIPLSQAVQALSEDAPQIVVDRKPPSAAKANSSNSTASKVAPRSYKSGQNRALSSTGAAGVSAARPWIDRRNAPARGKHGRIVYTFGQGLPEIVCAPLRICTLELQAGEQVVAEPQIGDAVRWHVTPSVYGQGQERTELVVIKPQEVGLDTNLVLTTNRRVYYIRLVSRSNEYMPQVAFKYPDDDRRAWEAHMAHQKKANAAKVATLNTSIENLNFNYDVKVEKGDGSFIAPQRVFDDGQKTYIQLPPGAEHRETPALMLVGPGGSYDMINYRYANGTYVVDRLFDKAVLILDVGRNQRRVTITSRTAKQPWLQYNTNDWFGPANDLYGGA